MLGSIALKDFSKKFPETPSETSPYVEIFCGREQNRKVIKKCSLCWQLRNDTLSVTLTK